MTTNEIHERLRARFGEAVGPLSEPKIDPFCVIRAERLVEACRWLIDRLKEIVPIWKKEALETGEADWVMGA